ncbi:reverse transcriptase domain-containing protein, partial [Tanacetum coccineum]
GIDFMGPFLSSRRNKFLKSLFARFGTPRAIISDRGENRASCSDKLEDALWAFRTAFKTPIGCTPYKLVYEKKTTGDHQKVQMNELRD